MIKIIKYKTGKVRTTEKLLTPLTAKQGTCRLDSTEAKLIMYNIREKDASIQYHIEARLEDVATLADLMGYKLVKK